MTIFRNWQVKFGPRSWREDKEIVLSENKIDKNKGHKKIKIIGIVGALAVSGIAVACVKRMKSENQIVSAQDTTNAIDEDQTEVTLNVEEDTLMKT